eukprot:8469319-Prorocentrum_lima.AAC.1
MYVERIARVSLIVWPPGCGLIALQFFPEVQVACMGCCSEAEVASWVGLHHPDAPDREFFDVFQNKG